MAAEKQGRYYNPKFYRELASAQDSARVILPIVLEVVKPASVIDIGCGTGHWLSAAQALGIKEVLGVDGPWARSQLVIPAEDFLEHDLASPLKLGKRFDLALSLEVAEHLPESAARTFVQSLCSAADVVLFSAAIPGQGGRRHINEQWPAYWAELFQELGYECCDYLRPRIWSNPMVAWYYAQNSLVFVRSGAGAVRSGAGAGREHSFGQPGQPLALVHPALWSAEMARTTRPGKLLERLFRALFRRDHDSSGPVKPA